ncbi:MAG: PEP/pyruvate-binding domain-containing protein, partial [Phycisphaerae bacterium]|nr:PEP/pyruvate-binding domain-containing protein [Phycisphaerae bacterium]
MAKKYVYFFGGGKAEGKSEMKNLLGGKGANLAEMASLGIPVPPGFTITTEVCTLFYENNGRYPKELKPAVDKAMRKIERIVGKKFGDADNPLLVSGRSGARQSMPGMMETVLNIGLTSKTIKGLIAKTGNPRFAYDAYRRLITMYSDVVMEKAAGIEPEEGKGIRAQLEALMAAMKKRRGAKSDTDLGAEDLEELCEQYRAKVKEVLGKAFPDDAYEQLWGSIGAVFQSWNGRRAIAYRKIEGIPDEWGTATNVQVMVFGNTGDDSATGVAFTRNPATGENKLYGEYLMKAQGEEVVAGVATPRPIADLEAEMPEVHR